MRPEQLLFSASMYTRPKSLQSHIIHRCRTFLQNIENFMKDVYKDRYGEDISDDSVKKLYSVAVSIFAIGGMLGGFSGGIIANRFGRLVWHPAIKSPLSDCTNRSSAFQITISANTLLHTRFAKIFFLTHFSIDDQEVRHFFRTTN